MMSFQVAMKKQILSWITHLHNVMIFISQTLLLNIERFKVLPINKRKELKNIDAEFQVEVGYWVSSNHLQDYKIYGTMKKIKVSE